MAKEKLKMNLPSVDDLFSTEEQRQEEKLANIYEIPIREIDDFPEHPFKVRDDEDMQNLIESVREHGVITPATVRKKEDGRYEVVSGHRRKRACELLGMDTLRCEVVEMAKEEATVMMVESNFQRSVILPSEKAFAYKMRLEAMKRQGQRSDLTSTPVAGKFAGVESAAIVGAELGESSDQVRRYIRLTNLVPELLQFVDEGRMKLRPAVELSYLDEEAQRDVVDCIDEYEALPSHDQAIRLRKEFEDGRLDHDGVDAILREVKPNQKPTFRLKYEDVKAFFKPGTTTEEVLADILKGLELLKKQRNRGRDAR